MNVFSDIVINKYSRGYFMKKINELNVEELRQLKNIVLQYSTLDELAPIFRKFGEFYPPIILMSLGAIKEDEKAIKAGFYSAEASLLGLGITFVGKNIFSRARPYMDEGADSWNNERFNEELEKLVEELF